MGAPYLHPIQYHGEPEHEEVYDRWYNIHVLNVLQVPGYEWCSRYVSLEGDYQGPNIRNLTLYIVADRAAFDVLWPSDVELHRPALREDQDRMKKLEGVQYSHSSVYEQTTGSHLGKPLLRGNRPLLMELTDVAPGKYEEWNRWVEREELPSFLEDPWIAMGGHFRAIEGVLPPGLVQGPRYLTLYELISEEAAHAMYDRERMSPALRQLTNSAGYRDAAAMTERRWLYFYKPISQHWSYDRAGHPSPSPPPT